MSDNKEFGFDILENSDMKTIEDIGTEKIIMDKKDVDRILKNTMKKYEKQKKQSITSDINEVTNEDADSVSGVEAYKHRHIPQIIFIALCSAAAFALVFGGIAMLGRKKQIIPEIQNPITEVTSTTITVASSTNKTTSTAVTTNVTGTETATETSSNNTTTEENTTTAASTTGTTSEKKTSDTAISASYANPHTDRTDITQDELEKAALRSVKELRNNDPQLHDQLGLWSRYAFYDVNADSVPELFVNQGVTLGKTYMFVYDGNDYVIAHFNGHDLDGNAIIHETVLANIDVFTQKSIIGMTGRQEGSQSFILSMGPDNTITPMTEITLNRYYKDGRLSEEFSYDDSTIKFRDFFNEYMSYESKDLNWISYSDEN